MSEQSRPPLTVATGGNAAPVEEWRVQLANIERQITDCLVAGQRGDWVGLAHHAEAIESSGAAICDWARRRTRTKP